MENLAAQIRALLHAQAPGLDQTAQQLPDAALLAIPAAGALLVLIILFAIIGALGGGKKKRAKRGAEIVDDEDDDLPVPAPVRAPPLSVSPPAPAPDRRAETLIEALQRARAPEAEPPSSEERLAQEQAAIRVVKESPVAAKAIAGGDLDAGFQKLAAEATALAGARKPQAAQAWRDLGVLAESVDQTLALQAMETAFKIDPSDFWSDVFFARALTKAARAPEALGAAQAAAAHARGPREKAIGQAELGDANANLGQTQPARAAYQNAIDALRSLARSGERRAQHDLSVGLNKLGDLEAAAGDNAKARVLFEEDLTISRHLAKSGAASASAERNVVISLVKLAAVTNERATWIEARDMAEALFKAGKMAPGDAPLLDGLRKQAAAG